MVCGVDAGRARTLTLVATILGSGMALLDSTVVNVALPAIENDLGGGLTGQVWVVNAYLLTLGSLILIGGSLGDIYGQRRIFALGVGSFGVASLLCALAPGLGLLTAGRALQGLAAAAMVPSSLSLIAHTFPAPRERARAVGIWVGASGLGFTLHNDVVAPYLTDLCTDEQKQRWLPGFVSGEIITAAGVSAGIDMALHLVGRLHSVERAREVRRYIQYDPEPPV